MEISQETAAELSRRLQAASESCQSSLRVIMTHQSLGEVTVYGRLVGNFMGQLYTNVLAPLWKAFPEIEPEAMKTPYVEPVAELSPEAKMALQSFAAEASAALRYAREVLREAAKSSALEFGGLPEVEEALQQIKAFEERPHFR